MSHVICEVDECLRPLAIIIRTYGGSDISSAGLTGLCTYHAHKARELFLGQFPIRLPHEKRIDFNEALQERRA